MASQLLQPVGYSRSKTRFAQFNSMLEIDVIPRKGWWQMRWSARKNGNLETPTTDSITASCTSWRWSTILQIIFIVARRLFSIGSLKLKMSFTTASGYYGGSGLRDTHLCGIWAMFTSFSIIWISLYLVFLSCVLGGASSLQNCDFGASESRPRLDQHYQLPRREGTHRSAFIMLHIWDIVQRLLMPVIARFIVFQMFELWHSFSHYEMVRRHLILIDPLPWLPITPSILQLENE